MRQGCGERGRYSGRVEGEAGRGAQAGDSGRNQGRRETMILYLPFLSIPFFFLSPLFCSSSLSFSLYISLAKGGKFHLHAPIGAFIFLLFYLPSLSHSFFLSLALSLFLNVSHPLSIFQLPILPPSFSSSSLSFPLSSPLSLSLARQIIK